MYRALGYRLVAYQAFGSGRYVARLQRLGAPARFNRTSETLFSTKAFDQGLPLCVERWPPMLRPGPTIPVACVALVAFFAMQICVNRHSVAGFKVIYQRVGSCPVTLGIPPQRCQGREQIGVWGFVCQRLSKIRCIHNDRILCQRGRWRRGGLGLFPGLVVERFSDTFADPFRYLARSL